MDARSRAQELAEENGMHVVRVMLRGEGLEGLDEALRSRLLDEAGAEARAVVEANEWPIWWAEELDDARLLVVDGLAEEVKAALVALEEDHPLGPWWNLDLVTEVAPASHSTWHASPMRPGARERRAVDELSRAVDDYDWS
ncbi:citrate lyase holo-[acyl-carrier protein] synthase [Luteococcus peritonei]|uniref:Citrate lyase holo-[acyl-carrier protein] synthase n=1 Tax=Luteococcus peritonei TaxID=88874 RepID=A0ABW4RT75_9ACTN